MTNNYTSLPLSKKLYKNGCKLKSEKVYSFNYAKNDYDKPNTIRGDGNMPIYPAYDLLWDICVKHHKKFFFGAESYNEACVIETIRLLQQDTIQEAEDYI